MNSEEKKKHRKEYMKEYHKQYFKKNRELMLKQNKEYYKKNKIKVLATNKKYYEKDLLHSRAVRKKYRETHKGYMKQYLKKYYNKYNEFILNYKSDKFCVKCGWKEHPEILQFHHNQQNKEFGICNTNTVNEKLIKEIKKCILLCPNCHFLLRAKKKALIEPRTATIRH